VNITSGNGFQMLALTSVAQPLSQLDKVRLGVETAHVQQQMAVAMNQDQRNRVAAQTKHVYHRIVSAQESVSSDAVQIRFLEEALKTTNRYVEQEMALKADSMQLEAALAQQRLKECHDKNELVTYREQLNQLLGRDLDSPFEVEPSQDASTDEIDLSAARERALRQRPEIRAADLQIQKARLDERRETAEYIPDISAQVTYLRLQNLEFLSNNSAVAGFALEWQNPWDWGRRSARISALKHVTQQQRLSAEDARQRVLMDVSERFRNLKEARLAVRAASAAQAASAEKLRNVTNQYREEQALLQDVLKQSADFDQTKASYIDALQHLWSARADFDRARGEE
jgi:outer membrane protein TolC